MTVFLSVKSGMGAFHVNPPADIPLHQAHEEVSGGIGGLLGTGGHKAEPGGLIIGGILEQAQLWISNAAAGDYLHIYLNSLSRIGHLLVKFWDVSFFLLFRKHAQLTHDTKQALRPVV
ncbi:hypothetical protein D7X33_08880 [Butyricicoccus sp. 1XD8-22]|nr:hypothetical protein D7X33_08880 [Butyricicoccus sp. 1XD8-22]